MYLWLEDGQSTYGEEMEADQPNYYLVIDAETTYDATVVAESQEVIEFAIVAIDAETGQVVGDFQRFVRPEVHTELSENCMERTGITQSQVDESDILEDVISEAKQWVNQLQEDESTQLLTVCYHSHAVRTIYQQAKEEEIELSDWLTNWVHLQAMFKRHFALKERKSLDKALEYLGIEFKGRLHSSIDDAHNAAQLFLDLLNLDARLAPKIDQTKSRTFGANIEEKPGDWRCDQCNFLNFARRNFCKDCGSPKKQGHASDGERSYAPQETKPGDWHCEQCNFHNFARRNFCKSCGHAKPGAQREQRNSYGRNNYGGDNGYRDNNRGGYGRNNYGGGNGYRDNYKRGPRMKPGDWRCSSCQFVNFARRSFCKSCGQSRPPREESQMREGDWNCPDCQYLNFAYRSECGQCGRDKPSAEG